MHFAGSPRTIANATQPLGAADRTTAYQPGLQERLTHTVAEIIAQGADRARLLELHYWSKRREDRDLIHAILSLRKETRRALRVFLSTQNPRSIVASESTPGSLSLIALTVSAGRQRRIKNGK
jgi:hypothetical protein